MGTATDRIRHRQLQLDALSVHVAEAGRDDGPALLFLHGWPESWQAFEPLMALLQDEARLVAIDLPGIGGSAAASAPGDKRALAAIVGDVVERLGLREATLVGHDVGGMVAYAFLRRCPGVAARAVVMNTAIPGVDPWDEVVADPRIWHFAFHAVPDLPETLVDGHVAEYFDFFQRALSATPAGAGERARTHAAAYATRSALHAGFGWYRAFERDARDNRGGTGEGVDTPVLYLRGGEEAGIALDRYVAGLRASGLRAVRGATIAGSGHFAPEERPAEVASALRTFLAA